MSEEPLCASCRRRTADARWRPFCSERCRMVDLNRWLSGDYRIAGAPDDPDRAADEPDRQDEGLSDRRPRPRTL